MLQEATKTDATGDATHTLIGLLDLMDSSREERSSVAQDYYTGWGCNS